MNLRLLSASARRSLRPLAPPTTTAGIHTAFPASLAYPTSSTHNASNSSSHGTPANSAAPSFQSHSSDLYSKDIDASPPENTKLHSIDPEAEVENLVASFAPAPSGDGSRPEVTSEYKRVNAFSHPYVAPAGSQNYGNMNQGS